MTHSRTNIRSRAHLILSIKSDDYTVSKSRTARFADSDFPAQKIYFGDEELAEEGISKGYHGVMSGILKIDCMALANDDLDDMLDEMLRLTQEAFQEERSNTDDDSLSNQTLNFYYMGLEEVEYDHAEMDLGGQTILYLIEYEQAL